MVHFMVSKFTSTNGNQNEITYTQSHVHLHNYRAGELSQTEKTQVTSIYIKSHVWTTPSNHNPDI